MKLIIFDTTCNSWHGLPEPLKCPDQEYRKSIAVYLTIPQKMWTKEARHFLLLASIKKKIKVIELIKIRSDTNTANVYTKNTKE